jgi:hypothetical protein
MAFTDLGTITTPVLNIAFATANPVKARITTPVVVAFVSDLVDGASGDVLLTYGAGAGPIKWPASVRWDGGNTPHPRGNTGDVAHFKFLRDAAVGYFGRLVVSGA